MRRNLAIHGHVRIYVGDGSLLKFSQMFFDPFRRAEQTELFAVPFRHHDRATRHPAGAGEFAQAAP